MDGYDQLWSLVEADEADLVPGLVAELSGAGRAADLLSHDLQVDLSAIDGSVDDARFPTAFQADFLAGPASSDDFFPIHACGGDSWAANTLPGIDPSAGESPLVLPTVANDVFDIPEPLVLPGVMDDDFFVAKDGSGPWVLPSEPDILVGDNEHFLGLFASRGGFDLPVDHTLYVDDHGLIGAHGSDDWLL